MPYARLLLRANPPASNASAPLANKSAPPPSHKVSPPALGRVEGACALGADVIVSADVAARDGVGCCGAGVLVDGAGTGVSVGGGGTGVSVSGGGTGVSVTGPGVFVNVGKVWRSISWPGAAQEAYSPVLNCASNPITNKIIASRIKVEILFIFFSLFNIENNIKFLVCVQSSIEY